ncbi:MAG: PAS domain S-box protein [Leptolyngbyaceae cyanobacterium]
MSNFKRESISSVQVQHYYHHLSPQTAAPDLNAQIWFAGLPAAALLIAPQGTIIAANALAAQLLAQSQSELIHQSLASLFPAVAGDQSSPVSRLECRSPGQVTGLKGTGEVVKLQFRVITDRDDQAHLLLLSEADTTHFARVSALIDAYLKALQGDTEAVRPINGASAALETESTDRDRQSHAVGANRFILAPLPGHAEPCLLRLTPEGQLTDVNDACCHLWGQPASALVGRHVSELWPEQQELISRQWAQINQCTPRDPVLVQAHPTVTATGQTIQHQWIYQALFDDRNQLQAVQAVGIELGGHPRDTPLIADYDQQLALFFAQAIEGCFFMMLDEPVRWDDSVDKEAVLDYAFAHQRITRVNQALLQQYGCTESEAIGQTPNDFFAHDLATCRLVLRQLFDEGHLHINTHERKADGTPMWIEGDYICLYDAQGRITGNFGVQRDVTHIREAIAAVAQSEQQYRLLVENQTDFIVKTDVDGNFLFVSPSYCHLCGLPTEELLTQTLLHGRHPEDQAATQWALAALHFPPHTCKLEQRLQTPRGWRWLAWTYTAVLDEAENIIAVVGAGRDVTERKAMESQLQQSERQFRNVLETLTLVAIMLDRQGKILFCNDYLLSLTGWNCDEVLGQSWAEQFLPADIRPVLQQWLQQTFEQQIFPSYYENEIVTREGDRRLIAWNNTVQRDSAGQVLSLTSIGEDITERKRTQDQIYELSQRLSLATQSSQSGVWDLDIATNQVVWDERMYGIYGLSPAKPKMTYRRWQARVHPDDIAVVRRSEHQIEQGSNNLYCEFRIVCPNGNIRHIEAHTCVLRDKQGNPRRLIGMNRDISDRKAAESALAMAHQQLQALMQNSPAIVALFDENGSYQRVNTITSQLFNQPAAAIAGRTFSEIHPPEMSALLTARLQQLTTTQQPLVVEDRLTTRDGDRFLQSVLFPVMSRPDQPDLFGWIATDITELVQAKEHLQRQAERERLLREITTNIRQSLHLKTILNSTADSVRDFLDTDRVLIYRFNSDWSCRILVESVGPQWIKTLDLDLMDPCLSTTWVEPYLQGRVSQITDIDSDEIVPCHRAFLKQFQVRANLVLPLVVDDQLWGLLCIHHCRSPRQWSPEDVVFVQQVCDQVDIAIQQAKLLQSEKSRARRESLHRRITQDIRRSLDIETILQTTADEIRAFLKTDRVLINRIDAESGDRQILSQSLATDIAPIEAQDAACPCLDQGRAELLLQYP